MRDPDVKAKLARRNRQAWQLYGRLGRWLTRNDPTMSRVLDAVQWQADHFEEIPVIVVAGLRGPRLWFPPIATASYYGSVFPSVQNLLLAARGVNLGAALITLPLWSTWSARRLTDAVDGFLSGHRVLICDRDRKWTDGFHRIVQGAGVRIVLTPVQAPNANAHTKRFVRSIRMGPPAHPGGARPARPRGRRADRRQVHASDVASAVDGVGEGQAPSLAAARKDAVNTRLDAAASALTRASEELRRVGELLQLLRERAGASIQRAFGQILWSPPMSFDRAL